jgi:hypothetical protein
MLNNIPFSKLHNLALIFLFRVHANCKAELTPSARFHKYRLYSSYVKSVYYRVKQFEKPAPSRVNLLIFNLGTNIMQTDTW